MRTRRRITDVLLVLLAAGVVACGSQSQANEAAEGEADSAVATAEETGRTSAGDAAAATEDAAAAEEPAASRAAEPTRSGDAERRASRTTTRESEPATTTADETTAAEEPPAEEPAVEPEPAPDPEPTVTIPSGTAIRATLDGEISTKTAKVGDRFTATVSSAVVEGRTVLVPEGATLTGEVTGVQKKEGDQKAGLGLAFRTLTIEGEPYPFGGSLTSITPKTEREMKDEGAKIGGGAAAGGLLGAIIGGDAKGAVIGAAAGAAAGTVVTLATREEHAVLPAGTAMELRVDESLDVRM